MEYWTSIVIGILTSFVASIIFFFCSRWIKRKSNEFVDWVASKNKRYSDKMYSRIAKNNNRFGEFFPSAALIFIIMNFLMVISLKVNQGYEIQIQVIEELKNHPDIDYKILYQLEEEFSKRQNFENRSFVWENFWIYTFLKYFLFGMIFITTGYLAFYVQRWLRIKDYNWEFRRSLEIISPYVEKDKIAVLKSRWALMTSKKDYDEVMEQVDLVRSKKKKPAPAGARVSLVPKKN